MLRKNATIAISVLALSLFGFAGSKTTQNGEISAGTSTESRPTAVADRIHTSSGRGGTNRFREVENGKDNPRKTSVPEPGSLLAFGMAMLIGATVLRRESTTR